MYGKIVYGIITYYEPSMMNPYLCISSTVLLPNREHTHTCTHTGWQGGDTWAKSVHRDVMSRLAPAVYKHGFH